jgi:hypothetical protein
VCVCTCVCGRARVRVRVCVCVCVCRWKCTFPSDNITRYMQGRRISVRQLLQTCGNTFTVSEIAGSRSKKLFAISDDESARTGVSNSASLVGMDADAQPPARPPRTPAPRQVC